MTPAPADLPPETEAEQPKQPAYGRLIQWMLFLSLVMLFLSLFLLRQSLSEQVIDTQTVISTLQPSIDNPEISPELQALNDELLRLRGQLITLDNVTIDLQAQNINWAGLMQTLGNYDPAYIQLLEIQLVERLLQVSGYAQDEGSVIVYERELQASEWFVDVNIQTIQRRDDDIATANDATATPLPYPIVFTMQLVIAEVEAENE